MSFEQLTRTDKMIMRVCDGIIINDWLAVK